MNIAKLHKSIHTKTGKGILIIVGDTYPIRGDIKANGFSWTSGYPVTVADGSTFNKYWWCYESNFTPIRADRLSQIGVDISAVSNQSNANETDGVSDVPKIDEPTNVPVNRLKIDQSFDGASHLRGSNSKWAGFPIKSGIYEIDVNVSFDNIPIVLHIVVDRIQLADKAHHLIRGKAGYKLNIFYNGERVYGTQLIPEKEDLPKYQVWNPELEHELFLLIPTRINRLMDLQSDDGRRSKLYVAIKEKRYLDARDPELVVLLNDDQRGKNIIPFTISEGKYSGTYNLSVDFGFGDSVRINPAIKSSDDIYEDTLLHFYFPVTIQNVQDLWDYVNNEIAKSHDIIVDKLELYLVKIAYLPEDKSRIDDLMVPIIQMIQGRNYGNVDDYLTKFRNLGYLRPRKKRKGEVGGGGMSRIMDDSAYMFDSKVIVDDFYHKNTIFADYFYTLVAYFVHYWKSGQRENFMPMSHMYVNDFVRQANNWGYNITADETLSFVRNAAGLIYQRFFHRRPPVSFWEANDEFNRMFNNDDSRNESHDDVLQDFVDFAAQYGLEESDVRSNPKGAYRILSRLLHPDMNLDKPDSEKRANEESFKILNNLFELVSKKLAIAFTWKDKFMYKCG